MYIYIYIYIFFCNVQCAERTQKIMNGLRTSANDFACCCNGRGCGDCMGVATLFSVSACRAVNAIQLIHTIFGKSAQPELEYTIPAPGSSHVNQVRQQPQACLVACLTHWANTAFIRKVPHFRAASMDNPLV